MADSSIGATCAQTKRHEEWQTLLLEYREAKRIAAAASSAHSQVYDAWKSSCGRYPDLDLDGRTMAGEYVMAVYGSVTRCVSEARGWPIRECIDKEWRDAMARCRRVDMEDKRRYRQMGLRQLLREADAASSKCTEAWLALCEYPVRDITELVRKIDLIESEEDDAIDYVDEIVADIRRISNT